MDLAILMKINKDTAGVRLQRRLKARDGSHQIRYRWRLMEKVQRVTFLSARPLIGGVVNGYGTTKLAELIVIKLTARNDSDDVIKIHAASMRTGCLILQKVTD